MPSVGCGIPPRGRRLLIFRGLLSSGIETGLDVRTVDWLCKAVVLVEPGERDFDDLFFGAAFGYLGV